MSSSKRLLLALTVLCLLIISCAPNGTALPATLVAVSTATQTPKPIPTLTLTQPPTALSTVEGPATASITSLPTIPSFTPTFDTRTIVTVTPAPSEVSHQKINDTLIPDFALPPDDPQKCMENYDLCFPRDTANEVLDFLNKGGTIQSVINRLKSVKGGINRNYAYQDVTGDSVPELLFMDFAFFHQYNIFVYISGRYELFVPETEAEYQRLYTIEDLNKNGVPEIVLTAGSCSGSGCFGAYAFEWDGKTFSNLSPGAGIFGLDKFTIEDVDHNGTKELILKGDQPGMGIYSLYVPWRLKTDTYMWNGQSFALTSVEFASPQYRFQAIQDADGYILNGNYGKALPLYQDAIFNDKLDWWSPERKQYFITMDPWRDGTETPIPTPIPNSTEYPKLAAYAYYRMVILHTRLGESDAAATQYASLQDKFPAASPGHPYAEMASAFWEAYRASQNMTDACGAAIAYAAEHPDILTVLGSDYHGAQSHKYIPADVCPFR